MGVRLVVLTSRPEEYAGVKISANEREVGFSRLWREKVRRALDLIERTSPRASVRIRRHIRYVHVDYAIGTDYVHEGRTIRLFGPNLARRGTASVAMSLIHEMTHARIADRGVSYSVEARHRHEALCVRAEAWFASRLPNGEDLAARTVDKLNRPWWTDEALQERSLAALERLDLPAAVRAFLRRRVESQRNRE